MAKSYKLSGTDNYIDASGVVYNKKELPTYLDKVDGIADGANKTITANNLTTTAAGSVLDARQGKILYDKMKGTVLFNNSSGEAGTVTLSKAPTINNFDFIDIWFFKGKGHGAYYNRVDLASNKSIGLITYAKLLDSSAQFTLKRMNISGSTLVNSQYNIANIYADRYPEVAGNNEIAIFKVIGYKYT